MKSALTPAQPYAIDLDLIWRVYDAASRNPDPDEVATSLGIKGPEFQRHLSHCPAFRNAYEAGKAKSGLGLLDDFVDDQAKQLWAEMKAIENESTRQQFLISLGDGGDLMRQKALLHAMTETVFDLNRCCKALGITKKTWDRWLADPRFVHLLDSVNWAKRNFAEAALLRLVAQGSEKATIAANQGLNRDVYGQKLEVSGKVAHIHGVVDISQLDLPLEVRARIIESVRESGLLDNDCLIVEGQVS